MSTCRELPQCVNAFSAASPESPSRNSPSKNTHHAALYSYGPRLTLHRKKPPSHYHHACLVFFPARALLLADRLYGSPWLLWELGPWLGAVESHYLVRVKLNLKGRRLRRLADGSWIVALKIQDPHSGRVVGSQLVREIRAQLRVEGQGQVLELRLWTSLFDPVTHPALGLVQLYAQRWEQKLFSVNSKGTFMGRVSCSTRRASIVRRM